MTTSQPWLSSQTASATIVADDITTAPVARTRSTSSGAGSPKWKLTTSGRHRSTRRQASSSNGCLGDPDDMPCSVDTELGVEARERFGPRVELRAAKPRGATWQKKLTFSGASRRVAELVDLSASCSLVSIAAGSEPRPPALRHSDGQRNTARTGHRRLHDGQLDSEPDAQLISDGHAQTLRGATPGRKQPWCTPAGWDTAAHRSVCSHPGVSGNTPPARKSVIAAAGSGRSPSRAAGAPSRRRDGTRRRTGQHRARRMPSVKADRTSRG